MSITDWFHRPKPIHGIAGNDNRPKKAVPDGVWSKCEDCGSIINRKELERNWMICSRCGYHYPLSTEKRIELLADEKSFEELFAGLKANDPLKFNGSKPYKKTLENARFKTGLEDAVRTGKCLMNGKRIVIAVMDFSFIGGSMGSVVGEKITRAAETSIKNNWPLVVVTASGGARMQEGIYSLFQMAKTSAVIGELKSRAVPYICIMTNPTTGGVTASFASLADIIVAEPKALIGFAGPRVIQETIGERLPKGFQSAETMLEHGLVDIIAGRKEQKDVVSSLLDYMTAKAGKNA